MLRAYDPRALRQQSVDRLVTTEDELRTAITQAIAQTGPARIRLASDIFITAPIPLLPSTALLAPIIVLDGGGCYGIYASSLATGSIFSVGQGNTPAIEVYNATIGTRPIAGFTLPCVFSSQTGANISVFGVVLSDSTIYNVANLFQTTLSSPVGVFVSTFRNLLWQVESGVPAVTCSPNTCLFDGVVKSGSCVWSLTNPTQCVFIGCVSLGAQAATLGAAGNTVVPLDGRGAFPFGLALTGSLALAKSAITLSSAGPTLTPGDSSFVRLTLTAGASGNVTVAPGFDGQVLRIFCASVAGSAVFTNGAGNLVLNATFTPALKASLELQYDATLSTWFEVARSSHTTGTVVASDPRLLGANEYASTVFRSALPAVNTSFVVTSGRTYALYMGRSAQALAVNFVDAQCVAGGTGGQVSELGIFSSPLGPNGASQTLTKIAANGTLSALTASGRIRNTVSMAATVPANTHWWVVIRCAMVTTQPGFTGHILDMLEGATLIADGVGALTSAASFTGTVPALATTAVCPVMGGAFA